MAPSEVRTGAHGRRRRLWRAGRPAWGLGAVLAFNAGFLAWLTLWPASAAARTLVADVVQIIGPLAALPALPALIGLLRRVGQPGRPPAAGGAAAWHRRRGNLPAAALSLGVVGYAAGSASWAYDELVRKYESPPTSAAEHHRSPRWPRA